VGLVIPLTKNSAYALIMVKRLVLVGTLALFLSGCGGEEKGIEDFVKDAEEMANFACKAAYLQEYKETYGVINQSAKNLAAVACGKGFSE
jgi:hypothetical protein